MICKGCYKFIEENEPLCIKCFNELPEEEVSEILAEWNKNKGWMYK